MILPSELMQATGRKPGATLRAIDLCCGAGGWACAARGLPIEIVLAVDWWDAAAMTYHLNHPGTLVVRADLSQNAVDVAAMRELGVDLVLGGIPCEWLSSYRRISKAVAVQHGEREQQRKLLDQVLGVVKAMEPRWWCLEDVAELRGELPPLTPHVVLDAKHWSGQRRKRVYVGEFPTPRKSGQRSAVRGQTLGDYLRPGPYRVGRRLFGREPQVAVEMGPRTTLGAWPDRTAPTVCTHGSRHDAELGVVDAGLTGGLRQLEWQERAALQGYPADYLFYGAPGDVDVMIGRSIQIDMGRAILEGIVREWSAPGVVSPRSGQRSGQNAAEAQTPLVANR